MKLYTYSENEFINYLGYHDAAQFDINDSGAILVDVVETPTPEEIEIFEKDIISIRARAIKNIVWLTFLIGEKAVVDAPFSLHLTKNLTDRNSFKEKLSSIRIALIDSKTGQAATQLIYYPDDNFIENISSIIINCYNMPFNKQEYFSLIDEVCNNYSAAQIYIASEIEYNYKIEQQEDEELTEYCPALQKEINSTTCITITDVDDNLLKPSVLEGLNIIWDESKSQICRKCKYHNM